MAEKRVLFLHGFMGSALNWGRIRTLLEAKATPETPIRTFAVDMLGHALNHPTDLERKGNAHEALVANLEKQISDFKPTHVVAHSFAIRPALLLGIKKPELIPDLIVEDSYPGLSQNAVDYLMGILKSPVPFRTRELAKEYFESKFGVQSALSRFFMSNIRSRPDGLADWRFDTPFLIKLLNESLNHALWAEWKAFPGKIELIYSDQSEKSSPELIPKMKESRPDLRVYIVNNSGHWIHADQAEAFVDVLVKIIL